MTIQEMLTIREVSRVLQLSSVRVWQLVKKKTLRALKRGGVWFIYPDSLREHIDERKKTKEAANVKPSTPPQQ